MKIVTVVGARPQFIKAAAVSRAIRDGNKKGGELIAEVLVHTGQHFDDSMSSVFFDELDIPAPDYNLGVSSLPHGAMTGRMLEKLEVVFAKEEPDWVLVYGDTNSTLAAALAAVKLHLPVAHVEAGLRSNNMRMPEEINRIISDRISTMLFCPTAQAVENLHAESITKNVYDVGDVMYDVVLHHRETARARTSLSKWGLESGNYALCTVHRAENTDDRERLTGILRALKHIATELPIVFPVHPRTKKLLSDFPWFEQDKRLLLIEPVSYLDMVRLESDARIILTDSGGVQKEAYFHKVPCLTLREETEWVETVRMGWNVLCGSDTNRIISAWSAFSKSHDKSDATPYGDGSASIQILTHLQSQC